MPSTAQGDSTSTGDDLAALSEQARRQRQEASKVRTDELTKIFGDPSKGVQMRQAEEQKDLTHVATFFS